MMFKELFIELIEKVSPDCSTGDGVIPDGPYKGWHLIRTSHLDHVRPNGKQRDDSFDCSTFDAVITTLLQKRPLGLKDGKMQLTWKNKRGFQALVVGIDNSKKSIVFVTIMQLNKKKATDYHTKGAANINLGILREPAALR